MAFLLVLGVRCNGVPETACSASVNYGELGEETIDKDVSGRRTPSVAV